jgi:hypothetical protein
MSALRVTCRLGIAGAWSAIAGILLSGPVATATVQAVRPQPAWRDARTFAASYSPVQALPYVFGLLFIGGCVVLVAALHGLARAERRTVTRLGLVFSGVGATFIGLNYVIQITFLPALVRGGEASMNDVVTALAMANPASLAWALEMWGYAWLGVGAWLAARALERSGVERAARGMLAGNGAISIAGAATTVARLEWVLSPAGLASYAVWNAWFLVTLALVLIALRRRAADAAVVSPP